MSDDKFTLDYSRRKHSGQHEVSRDEMILKNYQGELEGGFKNIVGPAFLFSGIYGFMNGIVSSARTITFRNRPKKLVITSLINIVGKQSSKYANSGAALGLVYCLTRKTVNFIFEEDLKDLSDSTKQAVFGFATGAIYKCTRGLGPSLFAGTLTAGFCAGFTHLYKLYLTK